MALLIQHSADVNKKNCENMTSLMLASQRGHSGIVKKLVQSGADIDVKSHQGTTSLMLACKRNNIEVAKILVGCGAELMFRDHKDRTARQLSILRKNVELSNLLAPEHQIKLMKLHSRAQRSYIFAKMWILLQQERAVMKVNNDGSQEYKSIHHITKNIYGFLKQKMPRHEQAIAVAMALPASAMELIAGYVSLPDLWDERIRFLRNRSQIDPPSTLMCAFDLIDEVFAAGGFVKACELAKAPSPGNFKEWEEWENWGKKCDATKRDEKLYPHLSSQNIACDDSDSIYTLALPPMEGKRSFRLPPHLSTLELRRKASFLTILSHNRALASILARSPYNMAGNLIRRLKKVSDVQTIVRRVSAGVHFDAGVAVDVVMLASEVAVWHQSNFDNENHLYCYELV